MDDHVSVAVVHGRDDLLEEATSFRVLHLEDTILRMRLACRGCEGTRGNGRGTLVQSVERELVTTQGWSRRLCGSVQPHL